MQCFQKQQGDLSNYFTTTTNTLQAYPPSVPYSHSVGKSLFPVAAAPPGSQGREPIHRIFVLITVFFLLILSWLR